MTTFEDLEKKIHHWGITRNITNPQAQIDKVRSEITELEQALHAGHQDDEIDAVGDVLVVLINYCRTRGLDPVTCLERSWNEIKSRQGITIAGFFVKKSDIVYGNENFMTAADAFFKKAGIHVTLNHSVHGKAPIVDCFKGQFQMSFFGADATECYLNAIKHYS